MFRHIFRKLNICMPKSLLATNCIALYPKPSISVSTSKCSRSIATDDYSISELTNYVNKELFFLDPPEEKADTIRTWTLLKDCCSPQDVLRVVESMHQKGRLWNEELLMYYSRLIKLLKLSSSIVSTKDTIDILNHPSFHLLLKNTMKITFHMNSKQLSYFFYCINTLKIPSASFVIKYTIDVIQNKINNFFPQDVLLCHAALRNSESKIHQAESLSSGLLMHLENLAKDEEFFVLSTTDVSALLPHRICKTFGSQASPYLKKCLSVSLLESMRLLNNDYNESKQVNVGIKVLDALCHLQYSKRDVVIAAMEKIQQNSDSLSSIQKFTISQLLGKLHVSTETNQKWCELLE